MHMNHLSDEPIDQAMDSRSTDDDDLDDTDYGADPADILERRELVTGANCFGREITSH